MILLYVFGVFSMCDWLHDAVNVYLVFCARQHICYSAHTCMLSPVRLSVCPSVTRVDQSKTLEVRIMQLSPSGSPMTVVSSPSTSPRNSKGNIGSEGAKYERGRKIRNFQPISRRISETVQDRTMVTIND